MSAPENLDTRARLLVYARWAAIGLAAFAALLIAAFSGATALRIAAFMAVVAVVLVVLSITMNGAASTKVHLEETLLDEIDMLRDDVRADITTAARATHRALAEKVAHLHQNIEHMRRDIDSRALGEAPPPRGPVGAPPQRRAIAGAAGPVVHHTETVHVTTHQTYVDPADDDRGAPYAGRPPSRRPERDERPGPVDRGRGGEWDNVRPRADDRYAEPAERWDAARDRRPSAPRPREEAWSDAHLRDYVPPPVDPYDDADEIAAWRDPRVDRDDDPADDPRWTGMRSGDRWAEVRADEHGREVRMGERRRTVRADETGTQMRIVDRWSSVREDNPHYSTSRYGEADSVGFRGGIDNTGETRRERRRREEAEDNARRGDDDRRLGRRPGAVPGADAGPWSGADRSRPALPASGPESAAGWIGGREDRGVDADRGGRRSRREISGEVIRPARVEPTPVQADPSWSAPRRPEARPLERVRDDRGYDRGRDDRARDDRGRDDRVRDDRAPIRDERGIGRDDRAPSRDDRAGGRDDNRWEREPSGGRQSVRPRLDFDGSDDRWR